MSDLVKQLLHSANLLVCVGGLATAPGMIAGGAAIITGLLSLREMQRRLPPEGNILATQVAETMRARLAVPEVSDDQRALIPLMIDAARPEPHEIINAGLNPATLAADMAKRITDFEQKQVGNLALFRAVLTDAFTQILNDRAFINTLAPAIHRTVFDRFNEIDKTNAQHREEIRAVNAKIDTIPGTFDALLQNLQRASRDQMEAIAGRFEIERVFDLSDAALREALEKRATDYRALKAEIAALNGVSDRIDNIRGAAEEALAKPDFDQANTLLENAREIIRDQVREPLKINATLMEKQADIALLRGRVDHAFTLLSAAADSFAAIDPLEPARRRILGYVEKLWQHGKRYGGTGLQLSVRMADNVLTAELRTQDASLWAAGQNDKANGLQHQGTRTAGKEGAGLLAQAVDAYRDALQVRTRDAFPVHWAMTQNNLAIALYEQGIRTAGAEGAALLAQAVAAYRDALQVYTRDAHPVHWATIQNNLATSLQQQGTRTAGAEGAALVAQAVAAYRDALQVYTRDAFPVDWAMTQNNLANALKDQGTRTAGAEGAALLAQAVAAYRDALQVRTRDAHPVQWAMTQVNLAIVELAWSQHDSCTEPVQHLRRALGHVDNALQVFDPQHMPFYHGTATTLRDEILTRLREFGEDI